MACQLRAISSSQGRYIGMFERVPSPSLPPTSTAVVLAPGTLDTFAATKVILTLHTEVLDLSGVSFVKPGGVATLASLIDAYCRTGHTLHVVPPDDRNARNYLARVHFPHFLDEVGCTHTFPTVRENDLGHDLVPLTRMTSGRDANALGEAALAFAGAHDEAAGQALCRAIGEAGENVSLHSGSPAGFVAAQRFPANSHFEFAVADAGYGLLTTLRDSGATDHATAIDLALTAGVSATQQSNRGFGLSTIKESVADSLGGTLSLLTGDTLSHLNSVARSATRVINPYQGTVVYARFRGHRRRR